MPLKANYLDILKKGQIILLSISLIFQLLGYAADILNHVLNVNATSFTGIIFQLFITIKTTIITNWISFSILFILLVLTGTFYDILLEKPNKKIITIISTILAFSNIIFCINFFDTAGINNKIVFLKNHTTEFIFFLIFLFIIIILILTSKKILAIKAAKPFIAQEITNNIDTNSSNANGNPLPSLTTEQIIKHPLLYIYSNYKYNKAIQTARKHQDKYKKLKDPSTEPGKHSKGFIIISTFLMLLFITPIIISILSDAGILDQFTTQTNLNIFDKIIETVTDRLINIINKTSSSFEGIEEALLNFILVIGAPILLFVAFAILSYSFTLMYETWKHISKNIKNDTQYVEIFASKIKKFLFDIADSAIKLLLFIPDFLTTIEDTVFDFDNDNSNITPPSTPTTDESDEQHTVQDDTENKTTV